MPAIDDPYILAHAGDTQLRTRKLLEVSFAAGTRRWTTGDLVVYALGEAWLPKALSPIRGVNADQGEPSGGATFEIGDATLEIAGLIDTDGSALLGTLVRLFVAFLDPAGNDTRARGTLQLYEGRIRFAESVRRGAEQVATIECGRKYDLATRELASRMGSAKCQWPVFGGPGCHAIGTDCDRTRTRCHHWANEENYGGFLTAPKDGTVIEFGGGTFTLKSALRSG